MISTHTAPNVNVSIRKVRMILPAVKKLSPSAAIVKLGFMPHSAAQALKYTLTTAVANAKAALKVSEDMLEFRSLKADQGLVLKRFRAGSRGSPLPVTRRMTHITVVLGEKTATVAPKKSAQTPAPKKAAKSSKKPAKVTNQAASDQG